MTRFLIATICFGTACASASERPGWRTVPVHSTFHAEGASAGDIDGDSHVDIVEGPLWHQGPDFVRSFELAPPTEFPVAGYSDQFFSSVFDATGDAANDVLVIGFPGKEARLYLNPGHDQLDQHWPMHLVTGPVDNESPQIVDFIPGGLPEVVCGNGGQYGYYIAGDDPTKPWTWVAISEPKSCGSRFTHAMGVGDVNGDGLLDVLDKKFWWEHPVARDSGLVSDAPERQQVASAAISEANSKDRTWKKRAWALEGYGGGGAQICVADLDGDGDSDIVTSYNAHGYGLGWFEQRTIDRFVRHDIMGESSTGNPYGVAFSQLHAVAVRDIDGDGRQDIVTGKRYYAHGGKDPGGLQEPVLYWFQNVARDSDLVSDAPERQRVASAATRDSVDLSRPSEPVFVPHLIDNNSGVGVDVLVADLNADAKLDVVTASKKGLIVHLQDDAKTASKPENWQRVKGHDQSNYADGFEPEEAAANMAVPPGFHVDLVASEPQLTQPIAMCFDARGRIWAIEGHTYPQKAAIGEGRDRVVILEDADGDGSFETRKTFVEGVNLASGIEIGFGGVYIGAAPELLFYPDADRNDVPDAEPTVLLDGWGYQDTHETLNSFTWGPDGWLYGCHGVFTHSKVGKPGIPDAERTPINAGIWRYHPTRHEFEVYAQGTSNPWGLDYDANGEWFVEACVIPHLFHIHHGARYIRQAGQHFNPYTYGEIDTIADHAHYTGGTFDVRKALGTTDGIALGTSRLGGGHAHCGFAFYNADVFPEEYRGDVFFHNLHGHRLVREKLERDGSGFVGRHRPDFALAQDHKQIGVGVMVGPDGAIYTSDWHDIQTCHNRTPEIWDRTDGRLFRIRYGDIQPYKFDLYAESDLQLVQRLESSNEFFARQAQRILQERAADGTLDVDSVANVLWETIMTTAEDGPDPLRQLWAGFVTETIDLAIQLGSPVPIFQRPEVKKWLVTSLGDQRRALDSDERQQVVALAKTSNSRTVRRAIASLLQRIPNEQRWEIVAALSSHNVDVRDRNIPHLVWYGFEPLVEDDPSKALALARKSGWSDLMRFTIRRMAASESGREQIANELARDRKDALTGMLLEELLNAATSRGGATMPQHWPQALARLSKSNDTNFVRMARATAVQFGDISVLPYYEQIAVSAFEPTNARIEAIRILAAMKDKQLPYAIHLLGDEAVRTDVIKAFAAYDMPLIFEHLIKRFAEFDNASKTAALSTLASRRSYAEELVSAMESGLIPSNEVPAFIVRQVMSVTDKSVLARLEKTWGKISVSSADKQAQYTKYRPLLMGRSFQRANKSNGRALYDANCGKCHVLFDTGGDIGPNITGANRTNADYWLENILEPNALIGRAYQTTTFILADGRVVSGLVKEENDDAVTVQTATEKLVIPIDDIDDRALANTSLMPEGQLERMSDQQVRELFAYLMGPSQVPRPGAVSAQPSGKPTPAGTIEGESLVASAKVSSGNIRSQRMSGFGPHWTGDAQLWWTDGSVDDTLEFEIVPQRSGLQTVTLQLTRAHDYGTVRVAADVLEAKEADLYDTQVSLAKPIVWPGVSLNAGEPIRFTIAITGKNPAGTPRFMVGVDHVRIEVNE